LALYRGPFGDTCEWALWGGAPYIEVDAMADITVNVNVKKGVIGQAVTLDNGLATTCTYANG